MLNTGVCKDCNVNVFYAGSHLWYKLKQSESTVSYLSVNGIQATIDIIPGKLPLDFECLHVDSSKSAFFDLHEIHLSQEFANKDGKTNLSTCLGIDTLRLPTQEELKQIPADDAIALFGKASIITQESVSVEADDLVFAVADVSIDAVSLFEDEESYRLSYMEALSAPYKGNYTLGVSSLFSYYIVNFTEVVKVPQIDDENSIMRAVCKVAHNKAVLQKFDELCIKSLNTFPVTEPQTWSNSVNAMSDDLYAITGTMLIENTTKTFSSDDAIKMVTEMLEQHKSLGTIQDFNVKEPKLVCGSLNKPDSGPTPQLMDF